MRIVSFRLNWNYIERRISSKTTPTIIHCSTIYTGVQLTRLPGPDYDDVHHR